MTLRLLLPRSVDPPSSFLQEIPQAARRQNRAWLRHLRRELEGFALRDQSPFVQKAGAAADTNLEDQNNNNNFTRAIDCSALKKWKLLDTIITTLMYFWRIFLGDTRILIGLFREIQQHSASSKTLVALKLPENSPIESNVIIL